MDQKGCTILLTRTFVRFDSIRFFLWGHAKTIVHANKSSSSEDLKAKISNVIPGITINQLANVFVKCKIVLLFVLLMMEDMWKLK